MRQKVSVLLAALLLLTLLPGCQSSAASGHDFTVVTSFYPIYITAINIAKDVPGVKIVNMTKPQTGCLHDYQLTPADLRTLEKSDVFVINGA